MIKKRFYVYIIKDKKYKNKIKIGRTNNPIKRLYDLQYWNILKSKKIPYGKLKYKRKYSFKSLLESKQYEKILKDIIKKDHKFNQIDNTEWFFINKKIEKR